MKTADVIIIGSGAAGLFNALFLPQDYKVIVITKKTVEESDSFLAQGGRIQKTMILISKTL